METATTGEATILCDESIIERLKPACAYFDSSYNEAHVQVLPVSAREAMIQLFAAKARGVIVSRPYLADEDSILRANKLPPHATIIIATDALVFYVQRDFPLDTISLAQLKQIFTDKNATLRSMFAQLKTEPVFVCPDAYSSEYGNLMLLLTKNTAPQARMLLVKNADSARSIVAQNPYAIGIGYLWHHAGDKQFKLLKIGFHDSAGTYISPKPVHQAYVVMGKYPFPIHIRGLLLEDRRNLPWGFMTFLRNDIRTKQYFLKSGIVPEGARFELVPTDDDE
ncbi:MAG: substrate-binding domain-containing protein [Candidatus Kapabacteria bacterium]|nr:substrate-binding domain-containing protein [Candidatus Kapabacteria bacterium]